MVLLKFRVAGNLTFKPVSLPDTATFASKLDFIVSKMGLESTQGLSLFIQGADGGLGQKCDMENDTAKSLGLKIGSLLILRCGDEGQTCFSRMKSLILVFLHWLQQRSKLV